MTIYLIRHGLTEANEKHLYCGSTDLPLSTRGREALRRGGIPVPQCARFLSSGMRRCNETMKCLFGDISFEVEPRFREIDFGIFEMKSYEELQNTPEYLAWITGDNEANVPPGGESGEQMTRRAMEALETVEKEQQDTVVVTHGGVIAAIMARLFPQEGKNRYQWQPCPGRGYAIRDGEYRPVP